MENAKFIKSGLLRAFEYIQRQPTTRSRAVALKNINNAIGYIDEIESVKDDFLVAEIEKGHMRIAHKEENDGIIIVFCAAEEYGEPGTVANDKCQPVPVVGLKLWGTKNARLIAESFVAIADEIDERRSNERS